MWELKKDFEKNIASVANSMAIYQYLGTEARNLDASVILRSQFVLMVSAFDTFIHRMVIRRIIDRFYRSREVFDIDLDMPLRLMFEMKGLPEEKQRERLFVFLNERLMRESFQNPRGVEKAFAIIGIKDVWTRISKFMKQEPVDIRSKLTLVVNRKNKIENDSDWNRSTGTYESIDLFTVYDCRDFIDQLGNAVFKIFEEIRAEEEARDKERAERERKEGYL